MFRSWALVAGFFDTTQHFGRTQWLSDVWFQYSYKVSPVAQIGGASRQFRRLEAGGWLCLPAAVGAITIYPASLL